MLPFIRSDLPSSRLTPSLIVSLVIKSSPQLQLTDWIRMKVRLISEFKQKLAWTYEQVIETNRYPDGGHEALKQAQSTLMNQLSASVLQAPISPSAMARTN